MGPIPRFLLLLLKLRFMMLKFNLFTPKQSTPFLQLPGTWITRGKFNGKSQPSHLAQTRRIHWCRAPGAHSLKTTLRVEFKTLEKRL